jgi:signal transduction histidine kinase
MLRDLSEAAGGRLRVDSAPGTGTTVELEVPLR